MYPAVGHGIVNLYLSGRWNPGGMINSGNIFLRPCNHSFTMTVIVHRATPDDIDPVFGMGQQEPAFGVSPQIRFYERRELEEWIAHPNDNILLVLDDDGTLCGFLFCKVMSSHWAYLDNFYVAPPARGHAYGHMLLAALHDILREQQIEYLSALVAETDSFLTGYFGKNGLETEKKYIWMEKFVR